MLGKELPQILRASLFLGSVQSPELNGEFPGHDGATPFFKPRFEIVSNVFLSQY